MHCDFDLFVQYINLKTNLPNFRALHFHHQEVDDMYKVLSAVLSMGEIQFGENDDDSAVVQDSAEALQTLEVSHTVN